MLAVKGIACVAPTEVMRSVCNAQTREGFAGSRRRIVSVASSARSSSMTTCLSSEGPSPCGVSSLASRASGALVVSRAARSARSSRRVSPGGMLICRPSSVTRETCMRHKLSNPASTVKALTAIIGGRSRRPLWYTASDEPCARNRGSSRIVRLPSSTSASRPSDRPSTTRSRSVCDENGTRAAAAKAPSVSNSPPAAETAIHPRLDNTSDHTSISALCMPKRIGPNVRTPRWPS